MSQIQSAVVSEHHDLLMITHFPYNNVTIRDLVKSPELDPSKDCSSVADTIENLKRFVDKVRKNENALVRFDGRFFRSMQYVGRTVFTSGHLLISFGEKSHIEIKLNNSDSILDDLIEIVDSYEK